MKAKRFLIVAGVCALFVLALYLLSLEPQAKAQDLKETADAYFELSGLLEGDPIDFTKAGKLYQDRISPFVRKVDKKEDLVLDSAVTEAFDTALEGNIPKIAARLAHGAIQRAFYLFMTRELKKLKDPKSDRKEIMGVVEVCYATQLATIEAADRWIGDGRGLSDRAKSLLEKIRSLSKEGGPQLDSAVRDFMALVEGAHVLYVISLVDRIEACKDEDKMRALELMADAKKHYEFFFEDHAVKDRQGSVMVRGEWTKQPTKVEPDMIRQKLSESFTGLIPELTKDLFFEKGSQDR